MSRSIPPPLPSKHPASTAAQAALSVAPVLPYASPGLQPVGEPAPDSAWQQGDIVIVRNSVILPDRCIKCNAPAHGPYIRCAVRWTNPLHYLLMLAIIVGWIVIPGSREGKLGVYLCARHRRHWHLLKAVGYSLICAGIATIFATYALESKLVLFAGAAMVVPGIVLIPFTRLLKPKHIDEQFIWLKGLPPAYVASFPPLPQQSFTAQSRAA